MGQKQKQWQILFSWAPKSWQMVIAAMKLKDTCSLEGKLWQIWQYIIKQRHHFADKGPYSQSYSFPAVMHRCKLDHIQGWAPRNWCFWTVILDKTLESPLDCKEIKSVNPKVNQHWMFIGRTDTEAECPILWPPDAIRANALEKTLSWEWLKAKGEGVA